MKIAIVRERADGETRVAATPETVTKLIGLGASVSIERGAGETARFPDAEYEKAEVDEDGEETQAGHFLAAAKSAGTAKGAGDFSIHVEPMLTHGFVPKALHLPSEQAHVCRAAERQSIAPQNVFGLGIIDMNDAHFRLRNLLRAFGDEFSHAPCIA